MDFLLAYAQLSAAMTFTVYLLAKHPKKQQTLYEEIGQHLGGDERDSYDLSVRGACATGCITIIQL